MPAIKLSDSGFRALGIFPLAFFLAQAVHYWRINELGHMLWMCNIGNLILAIGLFLNHALLIRIAVIWLFPGLVVWLIYVVLPWGIFLSSAVIHLGGMVMGLIAIRRIGMDRMAWAYAFLWYLGVQLLSRIVTATELNVNMSQAVEPGWRQVFDAYWKFWSVGTALTAFILWFIGLGLRKVWPAAPEPKSGLGFGSKSTTV
ncbi:MAG TPA: hypothetical protein VFH31_03765 [Pyrinomonadaceae bacterium]|nr:hypothetical protein [Pyrinomonadaceae bacterium]